MPESLESENSSWEKFRIAQVNPEQSFNLRDRWGGITVPGVIFIDEMFRQEGYHPSKIMKAVYKKNYALTSPNNAFVLDIKKCRHQGVA